MGRICQQAIFSWRPLSVCHAGLHHRLLRPVAFLLRAPLHAEIAARLLEHGNHLVLYWVPMRWYQLVASLLLHRRVYLATLLAQIPRQLVHQVQLHLVRGDGWRDTSSGVHFDFFGVWRRRKRSKVSSVLGE
jgi:hypothetical protein